MRRSLVLLTVLAAVLTGCGSDDGGDAADATTTTAGATNPTAATDDGSDGTEPADAPAAEGTATEDEILGAMGEADGFVDEDGRTCIAEGMAGRLSAAGLATLNSGTITDLSAADQEIARTTFNECVDMAQYAEVIGGQTGDAATSACVMAELTDRFEGFGDLLIALGDGSATFGPEIAAACAKAG